MLSIGCVVPVGKSCACVSLCIAVCSVFQDCSNLLGTCVTFARIMLVSINDDCRRDFGSILKMYDSITAVGMVLLWFSAAAWQLCQCCTAPSQIRFCVTMRTCTCVCTCHNSFPMRVLQVVCVQAFLLSVCACV